MRRRNGPVGHCGLALFSAGSSGIIRAKLPPLSGDFQSRSHTFVPKMTAPNTYIKRHNHAHGLPMPGQQHSERATSPRTNAIRLAALGNGDGSLSYRSGGGHELEQQKEHWSCSSVGDLEALDSILDQLVVLDLNMREALMNGPLISFETVVPEPRAAGMYQEDMKDHTFLTSVKDPSGQPVIMHDEDAQEEAHMHMPDEFDDEPESYLPQSPGGQLDTSWNAGNSQVVIDESEEVMALTNSMPVPILPKLARMYISNKQTQQIKAPPAAPPTADYLLRNRTGHNAANAPSYNALCQQIRDVQRQYTCGTLKEHQNDPHAPPANNTDMYISGIDGPTLDDVIMQDDLPMALPSAESMDPVTSTMYAVNRSASAESMGSYHTM
eukprot:gene28211-31313_t